MNPIARTRFVPPALKTLWSALDGHERYREATLNLIASENVMSPTVESFVVGDLSHRYGDYLGSDASARKYTGNRYLAEVDQFAIEAAKKLFGCNYADVRPLSGHVAGAAVIMALCAPGDTVLELDAYGGGHRLAGKLTQASLCPLNVQALPVDSQQYNIDVPLAVDLIRQTKPKLVILGSSLFLFPHPVGPLAEAVHAVGGHLLFDASHVLGLIASRQFPNPLDQGADAIISSTHKTFAGPQGGVLLVNDQQLYERIVPAIYPALVTNHHLQRIPAFAAVCHEWIEFGAAHGQAVVQNAQSLAAELDALGLNVVGKAQGFTRSHTVLLSRDNAKGDAAQLEEAGILVTPVGLPAPLGGSSLRIGVQEITRRGMEPADSPKIANLIQRVLTGTSTPEQTRPHVANLVSTWNQWRFTWEPK